MFLISLQDEIISTPARTRTSNLQFRRPTTDTDQVANSRELTKNGQNYFAINVVNFIQNEPELQLIIEVWPELPGHIKAAIKALITAG